jgi:tetratricopeptide (TPR) repeat protein
MLKMGIAMTSYFDESNKYRDLRNNESLQNEANIIKESISNHKKFGDKNLKNKNYKIAIDEYQEILKLYDYIIENKKIIPAFLGSGSDWSKSNDIIQRNISSAKRDYSLALIGDAENQISMSNYDVAINIYQKVLPLIIETQET